MRLSDLFTRTLREAPAEAELTSHKLAVRGGFVRPVAPGLVALMPLGWRVMRRLETIVREEWGALGGQEMRAPVLPPGTGRGAMPGATPAEVIAMLAAHEIDSYKRLPQMVFQFQTGFRDDARARGGLFQLRSFTAADAVSFHADDAGLDRFWERMMAAMERIFAHAGVAVEAVESNGGKAGRAFVVKHEAGPDAVARCEACGYAALAGAVTFRLPETPAIDLEPVTKVATPGCKTIQEVADYLGVPASQTLKAVFFVREKPGEPDRFVFAVVRGDLEVSETRLVAALDGGRLRPASDAEIEAAGAVPGYASPIELASNVLVVADQSVRHGANFVVGANEPGYHLTGVNVPRDFEPAVITTIAEVFDGAACGRCGAGTLRIEPVVELGRCVGVGSFTSSATSVTFSDENGAERPATSGAYRIEMERLMAAIIEAYHDDWGIIWPASVAPFDVHVLTLGRDSRPVEVAAQVVTALENAGFAVLFDDRPESAGVKFADADLIGVPVRLAVSAKSLAAGGVEAKHRDSRDRLVVPLADVPAWLRERPGG